MLIFLLRLIWFCMITLLINGCNMLSPVSIQPTSTYTLGNWKGTITDQTIKTRSSKIILVTTPVASPGFNSNQMIYVSVPYKIKAFSNNQWIAPPAQLLLPLIADALCEQHYFYAVIPQPFFGTSEYQLNTQLLVLQQEFLTPESQVRLSMQATILKTSDHRVIATRTFTAIISAPDNNPYSGVIAANKAATLVVNQIARFSVDIIKRS